MSMVLGKRNCANIAIRNAKKTLCAIRRKIKGIFMAADCKGITEKCRPAPSWSGLVQLATGSVSRPVVILAQTKALNSTKVPLTWGLR
jgi:hypothetical protein